MSNRHTVPSLEHSFAFVKSSVSADTSHSSDSMIHHKVFPLRIVGSTLEDIIKRGKPYGVSSSYKVLTKGLLIKKFDLVRDCLAQVCELPPAERDVTLTLLRLQAYYPQVYPKASQVASDTGHGVATFWRTVGILQDMNLLQVVNRYLIRVEAQISNLYLLDGLIILIARYLAEHIAHVWPEWLTPILAMPSQQFCRWVFQTPEARAGPYALA